MELLITGILTAIGTLLLVVEVVLIPGLGLTGLLGAGAMLGAVIYAMCSLLNAHSAKKSLPRSIRRGSGESIRHDSP